MRHVAVLLLLAACGEPDSSSASNGDTGLSAPLGGASPGQQSPAMDARPPISNTDGHTEEPGLHTAVELRQERSLVWTSAEILDDKQVISLAKLMASIAEDGHGGRLLRRWFHSFSETEHSERFGPVQLIEQFETVHGSDAERWDLDALPFKVTGVHNRFDLKNDEHCGEFRVSLASVDPVLQPFHLIFLFKQHPEEGDVDRRGQLHCTATRAGWARLSALDAGDFLTAARASLTRYLQRDRFIAAESLEFLISPWEWRQWFLEGQGQQQRLVNRPLFQTVDIEGLNRAGARREAFLRFVAENAAALDARKMLIPERFRAKSARLNQGVPWIPLSLDGLPRHVTERYPKLRQHIEIIGCPACHSADAHFVQTDVDRSFSDFYSKELEARGTVLQTSNNPQIDPPFGPLQRGPILHD